MYDKKQSFHTIHRLPCLVSVSAYNQTLCRATRLERCLRQGASPYAYYKRRTQTVLAGETLAEFCLNYTFCTM
jgi:hypothetical protein